MTIVTDELIRMTVLMAPSGTLSSPCGHSAAPLRRMMYVENKAPNSITSEARNSQMPSLPFARPVSGLTSTVYGMFTLNLHRGGRRGRGGSILTLRVLRVLRGSWLLRLLRLELRAEIPCRTRDAVLVRTAIHDRLGQEVAMSRRRGRRPFERRGFPRIPVDGLPPLDAHEEIDDEKDL